MFSAPFRIGLILVFLVLAGWLMSQKLFPHGIGLLMGVAVLVWGYIRNGSVFLANWRLRRQQYEKAEKLLNQVYRPHWLGRIVQAFYYSARGHIAFHRQAYTEAKQHFEKAHEIRPPAGDNRAVVLLNLAQLAQIEGNRKQAKAYVQEAREERISPGLTEALDRFAKSLR